MNFLFVFSRAASGSIPYRREAFITEKRTSPRPDSILSIL